MLKLQGGVTWTKPIQSLSPFDLVGKVSRSVRVGLAVGADDPITPPQLTEIYAGALRSQGVRVQVSVLPGLKHDLLLEPAILQQINLSRFRELTERSSMNA